MCEQHSEAEEEAVVTILSGSTFIRSLNEGNTTTSVVLLLLCDVDTRFISDMYNKGYHHVMFLNK